MILVCTECQATVAVDEHFESFPVPAPYEGILPATAFGVGSGTLGWRVPAVCAACASQARVATMPRAPSTPAPDPK